MEFWFWVQVVGAVFVGNLVAGAFGYAVVIVWRDERRGGDGWSLPRSVYLGIAAPLLFGAAVVYSLS